MKFVMAIVVWLGMAAVIGVSVLLAVKGTIAPMLISLAVFLGLMIKYGCLPPSESKH